MNERVNVVGENQFKVARVLFFLCARFLRKGENCVKRKKFNFTFTSSAKSKSFVCISCGVFFEKFSVCLSSNSATVNDAAITQAISNQQWFNFAIKHFSLFTFFHLRITIHFRASHLTFMRGNKTTTKIPEKIIFRASISRSGWAA